MTTHHIEIYEENGLKVWRIILADSENPSCIVDSGRSYNTRSELLKDLFGVFFGDYDESFLELYAEWNPESSQQSLFDISAL